MTGSLDKGGNALIFRPHALLFPKSFRRLKKIGPLRNRGVLVPADSPARALDDLRVLSLLERAEFLAVRGQPDRARAVYADAISLDEGGLARLKFGEFLFRQGAYEEAANELRAALEIGRHQKDADCCASASHNLAVVFDALGQSALAASYRQQAIAAGLRRQTQQDDESSPLVDYSDLANEAIGRGDLDEAAELAGLAINHAQKQNCAFRLADAWGTWAAVCLLFRDKGSAWRGFLEAYAGHCRARDEEGQIADLLNLAETAREFGWWEIAKRLLLKAGKVAQSAGIFRHFPKIERFLYETNRVIAVAERTPEWN